MNKSDLIPVVIGILMMMLPVIYILTRPDLEDPDDDSE